MRSKLLGVVAGTVLALNVAVTAHAGVVFNSGVPEGGGLEATESLVADDFSLAHDTRIGGAGVFMDGQIDHWTGGFQYAIYDLEDGAPGVVLTHGDVSVTPVDVTPPGGLPLFLFQFDLNSPFDAKAGQTYFLAVHARSDFRDNDGIFWAFTDPNGSLPSQFQQNGQGAFIPINGDMAFFLTSAAVPEPGSWLLMFAGVGLAGAALRHRRRAVLAA
jgi:hypothetical protein